MSHPLIIPQGYKSALSLRETQHAVKYIKDIFQQALSFALTLDRVTAPIIVTKDSGINDDLNGIERKVEFSMKEIGCGAEVVQSLAKWKRTALHKYDYQPNEGIYTDMNAIRRDDDVDNTHSIFVDQWDWEKIITPAHRNIDYLKTTVEAIVKAIAYTKRKVNRRYPQLKQNIDDEVFFITSQELEDMYPDISAKERERLICKEHKIVFVMQIGWPLRSGEKHDGRAPDYDDWLLNGDLLLWNSILDNALEISSMGIRVDSDSLKKQLDFCGMNDRLKYDYHSMISRGELPLTIGGGIGQSRLCMLMLEKAHIGEVQVSIWPDEMTEKCREAGIMIL